MPESKINSCYDAEALYNGGWRSSDLLYLALEYELSREEAIEICKELKEIEEDEGVSD